MAAGKTFERVRPPAVAGFLYPEDPGELRAAVDAYLADARPASTASSWKTGRNGPPSRPGAGGVTPRRPCSLRA